MERIINTVDKRYSYYNDAAIHLDITPWATVQKWSNYKKKTELIVAGNDIAIKIIKEANIKILLVCGKETIDYIKNHMTDKKEISFRINKKWNIPNLRKK